MEFSINDLNDDISVQERKRIRQKTGSILSKLRDVTVIAIKLTLGSVNGKTSKNYKYCTLVVHVSGLPEVIVSDNKPTVISASISALHKAKKILKKGKAKANHNK